MEGTQESKSKNEENRTTSSKILGCPGCPIVGQTTTNGDDLAFMEPWFPTYWSCCPGKSPCLTRNALFLYVSMVVVNSYVSHYQRVCSFLQVWAFEFYWDVWCTAWYELREIFQIFWDVTHPLSIILVRYPLVIKHGNGRSMKIPELNGGFKIRKSPISIWLVVCNIFIHF